LLVCEVGAFQQVIPNRLRNGSEVRQGCQAAGKAPRVTLPVAFEKARERSSLKLRITARGWISGQQAHLRTLLHEQRGGNGNRSGTFRLLFHYDRTPWQRDESRITAWTGHEVHRLSTS
jgi:hypothetical protein